MTNKLNVLMVSSEVEPFAKTGGLGDVVGALPKALNKLDVNCIVIMPLYKCISQTYKDKMKYLGYIYIDLGYRHQYCGIFNLVYQGVKYYFMDNEFYYGDNKIYNDNDLERFTFLSKGAFEVAKYINFKPNIIHVHDWHSASMAGLLNDYYCHDEFFCQTKCIYTIHNLAYQGIFPKEKVLDLLPLNANIYNNTKTINLMALGIQFAHKVTTVSPTYAQEILTDAYGERLQNLLNIEKNKLVGILNGLDLNTYNPSKDKLIDYNFNKNDYQEGKKNNKLAIYKQFDFDINNIDENPLIVIISRLASQKGMDLVLQIVERLLNEFAVKVVLLGSGDKNLENSFSNIANRYPKQFKVVLKFDNILAHKLYASGDLLLMPSAFEPCGLAQMIALQYGTLPLVRACGGLKDSIEAFNEYTLQGNGFSFNNYNDNDFYNTIKYALGIYHKKNLWNQIILNGFKDDFSWGKSAKKYLDLYLDAIK